MVPPYRQFVMCLMFLSSMQFIPYVCCIEYVQMKGDKVYTKADKDCKDISTYLPVIKYEEEGLELESFIKQVGINSQVWMGLQLPDSSTDPDDYIWADGSPIAWTNWYSSGGEPNNLSKDKCVAIETNLKWYTRSCTKTYSFVCQKPAVVTTTSTTTTTTTTTAEPTTKSTTELTTAEPTTDPVLVPTGHLIRLLDRQPGDQALLVIQTSDVMRCAARCLRQDDCDVIIIDNRGVCSLFPYADSLSSTPPADDTKVYQKIRIVQ